MSRRFKCASTAQHSTGTSSRPGLSSAAAQVSSGSSWVGGGTLAVSRPASDYCCAKPCAPCTSLHWVLRIGNVLPKITYGSTADDPIIWLLHRAQTSEGTPLVLL